MARNFNGSSHYLTNTSSPLNGVSGAFTVAFWFRAVNNSQTNTYICSGVGEDNRGAILYEYVNNTIEFFNSGIGTPDPRTGSGIVVADTSWHHIAYRRAGSGASEWAKYLDGAKTVINASANFSLSGGGSATFYLGRSSGGDYCNCEIQDFACWNTPVLDAHIEAMSKGFSPAFFDPTHYWSLGGNQSPEPNYKGTLPLTVSGATKADQKAIIYPQSPHYPNADATLISGLRRKTDYKMTPVLTTQMNNLSNGATSAAGPVFDNTATGTGWLYALFQLEIDFSGAALDNQMIDLLCLVSPDGTNYSSGPAETGRPHEWYSFRIGGFTLGGTANAQKLHFIGVLPASKMKFAVYNRSGANLPASGSVVKILPFTNKML